MKRTMTLLSALILIGAIAAPVFASGPNPTGTITQGEVAKFNQFLDAHPTVAQQLAANPSLINDPNFIANHPHLHHFLQNHPGVRAQIHQNPGQFMFREGHFQWHYPNMPGYPGYGGYPGQPGYPVHPGYPGQPGNPGYGGLSYGRPVTRGPHPLWYSDKYLDAHPEVAQQLERNPKLVDNPEYREHHPGLDEFLARHPDARQWWQSHPEKFMHHEERFDQREGQR